MKNSWKLLLCISITLLSGARAQADGELTPEPFTTSAVRYLTTTGYGAISTSTTTSGVSVLGGVALVAAIEVASLVSFGVYEEIQGGSFANGVGMAYLAPAFPFAMLLASVDQFNETFPPHQLYAASLSNKDDLTALAEMYRVRSDELSTFAKILRQSDVRSTILEMNQEQSKESQFALTINLNHQIISAIKKDPRMQKTASLLINEMNKI
jgi:hypothetical protein